MDTQSTRRSSLINRFSFALTVLVLSYVVVAIVLSDDSKRIFLISAGGGICVVLAIMIAFFKRENDRIESAPTNTNDKLQQTEKKLQQTLSENHAVISFAQVMYSNSNSLEELCVAGLHKINELFPYTYAAVLIYDLVTDTLSVQTEFGFDKQARRAKTFRNGEGLTGDAFLRQKTMRIQDAPQHYWHATSGMGAAQPAELLIIPMTFKSKAGVLELAFLKSLDEPAMATMQRIAVAFAANILTLVGNDEKTALAAKLQQQKDEITHSYAELEALRAKAAERMQEQYQAQQTLIRQIIEKGKQKEQELQAQIDELKQ